MPFIIPDIELAHLPPHVQEAFKRAQDRSTQKTPSTLSVFLKALPFLGASYFSYYAFRAQGEYAKDGFDHLFHTHIDPIDSLLEMGALIPPVLLSARSAQRVMIILVTNLRDVITLGFTRKADYHEIAAEFGTDFLELAFELSVGVFSSVSSAYTSQNRLKDLPYYLQNPEQLELCWRSAQVSSFNTNTLFVRELGVEPLVSAIKTRLRANTLDQVKRETLLAIYRDEAKELSRYRASQNPDFPKKIRALHAALHTINHATDLPPEKKFAIRTTVMTKFWLHHFGQQNPLHIAGSQKTVFFDKKRIGTSVVGAVYSLQNLMSGLTAGSFAATAIFFNAPSEMIGSASFIANTLINTTAINVLIDMIIDYYFAKRNDYAASWSGIDVATLITSLLLNSLYIFAQVGLASQFPAFSPLWWDILQCTVTAVAAFGLGTFSVNRLFNAIQEEAKAWYWRKELDHPDLEAYLKEHPDSEETLTCLAERLIQDNLSAITREVQKLPTRTIDQLFDIIEKALSEKPTHYDVDPPVPTIPTVSSLPEMISCDEPHPKKDNGRDEEEASPLLPTSTSNYDMVSSYSCTNYHTEIRASNSTSIRNTSQGECDSPPYHPIEPEPSSSTLTYFFKEGKNQRDQHLRQRRRYC